MNFDLSRLFSPTSIAVVGASNRFDRLGYHVMKSLVGNYRGTIYPVNARGEKIWDIDSYSSLTAISDDVDLAIVAVPALSVIETLHACGQKNVKGIVLITAGFKEIENPEGKILEDKIREIAAQYNLPIIGPNTFGFVNLNSQVNASFTSEFSVIEKGGVALISQSGGICHLCGFLAIQQGVAMSTLMSLGNRCNVDFTEVLKYLVEEDNTTRVIALYIEGLDEPRKLLNTAESLRGGKPIIAYKAGKGEQGNSASRFHTGSLAGNHAIWKGALRQSGILEVFSTEELLDTAKALDACPLLNGPRIAVLSGQAGPGIIAADALETVGLRLSCFSEVTQQKVNTLLPPVAIRTNPVDMGPAWYDPNTIMNIMRTTLEDEQTDGVIFIAMYASANLKLAEAIRDYMESVNSFPKPVIGCFTAPPGIWKESTDKLDRKKGLVVLPTPERAAHAMANLWKMNRLMNLKTLDSPGRLNGALT